MTEEEFNQAVAENFAKLVRTAEAVLGCEDSAKDSVQQAVIRVWKNIGSFDPKKGAFVTLLHVSVRRQAIDHKVSKARRLAAMERFWGEIIPERPKKADPRIKGLMDALDELPEKKRALIQKRFFEGKKVEEVAKEMGLSRAAMNARIQTLKGALLHKRPADWEDQRSASLLAVKLQRGILLRLYRAPPRSASVPNEIPILLLHRRNDDGAEEFSNEVHGI
jgi:RNA polymerase sigma factor (sigma-70 family)